MDNPEKNVNFEEIPEKNKTEKDEGNGNGNKFLIIFLALLFVGALIAAGYFYQRSQLIAIIDGERITKNDLYQEMFSYYGSEILDEMINKMLITQEAKKLNISVDKKDIDDEINTIMEQFGTEEEFYNVLEDYGDTIEDLRERIELDKMLREIVMIDLEIDEKELQDFFIENRNWFDDPEQIRLQHILVSTDEEANTVLIELEKGKDFGEVAAEFSQDTFTRDDGGDIGFLKRGELAYEFDEKFEQAAFSLNEGEYSAPIETYRGLHIIKLTEYIAGSEVSFEDVRDDVKEEMMNEKIGPGIQELLETLKNKAKIEIFV